jgi:hypothetical protein
MLKLTILRSDFQARFVTELRQSVQMWSRFSEAGEVQSSVSLGLHRLL